MILGQLCDEAMRIEAILQVIQSVTVRGDRMQDVTDIAYDSRRVRPGGLFVALPGARRNGIEFVDDAIRRGAVAIVSEERLPRRGSVTHIQVEDARRALAEIACAFYNQPSARLRMM